MTDVPPPGSPDRDPYGQPVQPPPPQFPTGPPQGYPGYPPQGFPAYPPGLPQRDDSASSRTKAVWALVLAILPLCLTWIAAAVLAIIVLAGPSDGRRRGRGMAWWSLGIVATWLVASVVLAIVLVASVPADRDEDGNVTSAGEVFPEDLRTGDCIDDRFEGDAETADLTVTVVPCDEPHPSELYHTEQLDDGPYPGESEIFARAEESCDEAFEPWVGVPYVESELEGFYYYPTEESWDYGDRAISCIVIAPGDVTGTLEGSGR